MDLKTSLSVRCPKTKIQHLANQIVGHPDRFRELVNHIIDSESPIPQYGAWVLQHTTDQQPELLLPHVTQVLHLLRQPSIHDAVKRGILRSLSLIKIDENQLGEAADICFNFLADATEPTAVKMFSMCVLWNICDVVPELKEELALQIEVQMPTATAGFASRGRKILKAMHG